MARHYTAGRLARELGLARSTLLYYDRIGLLKPSARSTAGYRLYSRSDRERLEAIRLYREVGLSLDEIRRVLTGRRDRTRTVLERRLDNINREIAQLREQQRTVVELLRARTRLPRTRTMDKDRWKAVLAAAGLSEEDMQRWHVEFERREPESHQDFLESLGLKPSEIRRIRAESRTDHER
jgi:DNA-binding transcriptional MerR regulator